MKKLFYIFAFIALALTSCDKNEVSIETKATKTLTAEQQKMRSALETTTNILLDMIASDQTYFDELNQIIKGGSSEYLEGRVLLKDLFGTNNNTGALKVKADVNKFNTDFKNSFTKNRPQKVNGNSVSVDLFSNPDSLIKFLINNNVSLYCPYPIENYAADNRTPAISFHPIDNDSVNVGFLLNKDGVIENVNVCQAYNDLHPVWILMPYEKICNNTLKVSQNNNIVGYEITVSKIYCKQYYGGIFDGDLDMHIIRANSSGMTYSSATNTYSGGIYTDLSFELPRSYVTNAKKNWWSGWFNVNSVWDTNWDESKMSNIIYVYEWDAKGSETISTPINTYDAQGKVLSNLGNYSSTKQSQDATIGLNEWSRYWFFDIINNGNPSWYWQHSAGAIQYKIDNNNIMKISNDFLMTMSVRNY